MHFIYCPICLNLTVSVGILCVKCGYICYFCLSEHNLNYIVDNKMPDCKNCFLNDLY